MTCSKWLAAACCLALVPVNQDPGAKELARLEGIWSFTLVEIDGEKQADAPFETNKMLIMKDGRYAVIQGPRVTRGTVKVDPAKTPKHYDVTITTGLIKGFTAPGIYELDGDTLKVCFKLFSKDRPTEFSSKQGSGSMVQVFKREKQDLKEALIEAGRIELTGTWQALTYALSGEKAKDEDLKKIKLTFDRDGKAKALQEGKVFLASTTRIDPAKEPMTMDITFTEGDGKGQTSLGIYKIEDDVLTICRAAPGTERPTEFASKAGSGHTLMTYRLEKEAGK